MQRVYNIFKTIKLKNVAYFSKVLNFSHGISIIPEVKHKRTVI